MKNLLTICLCFISLNAWAQTHNHNGWQLPCGTSAEKHEFLREYQRAPQLYNTQARNSATTFLPLTLHLVGRSDSSAVVALQSVLSSFCRLNDDYNPSGIQFFIEFPILYHYNDTMYSHDSVTYGGQFMLRHNVANTINVYFVSSPAGNCGYNLPYAGIAMNNGCLGGHTFAHEMGHALTLPHTFLGWEGGVSWDNSITPNFNAPAPRTVTYNYTNFKDTVWTDTLIIDTAQTEIVARTGATANCDVAADGFCDTEADYLAYRWTCNGNNLSTVRQLDADSVPFFSHGEYIMSYADDNCQSIFSSEQQAAMMAFINNRRQSYLYNQNPDTGAINGAATLIYPNSSALVPQTNVNFTWSAIPNATHYLLELYREPYANNTIIETVVVTDTQWTYMGRLAPRSNIFPYAWRVQGFNQGYTCTFFSPVTNFNTFIPAGVEESNRVESFNIYPNPANNGVSVQIEINANTADNNGSFKIYNAIGQQISFLPAALSAGVNLFTINADDFSQGVYFIEWLGTNGRVVRKWIKN